MFTITIPSSHWNEFQMWLHQNHLISNIDYEVSFFKSGELSLSFTKEEDLEYFTNRWKFKFS